MPRPRYNNHRKSATASNAAPPPVATAAIGDAVPSPPVIVDTPVVAAFRQYARELDTKHDRYERIVKRSRDITIESKRIIFQLHTVQPHAPDAAVLLDARQRLDQLVRTSFAAIAGELVGLDAYQFVRAYSAGLQEFVEALTYWQYVAAERLSNWRDVEEMLTTEVVPVVVEAQPLADEVTTDDQLVAVVTAVEQPIRRRLRCTVDPMEFMQGVGDLSGEVMRQCIGALGSGHFETCSRGCAFLRALHMGYNGLSVQRNRGLATKVSVLRQSLLKVEHVCYNIKVRGKEAGTLSLMMAADRAGGGGASPDDDEGFSNF